MTPRISNSAASTIAGSDSRNEKRAAVSRVNPRNRPALIVAPDRDTPGISAAEVVVSCVFAFAVGYASIAFLLRFLERHGLGVFVVYRIVLGVAVLALTASGAIS